MQYAILTLMPYALRMMPCSLLYFRRTPRISLDRTSLSRANSRTNYYCEPPANRPMFLTVAAFGSLRRITFMLTCTASGCEDFLVFEKHACCRSR